MENADAVVVTNHALCEMASVLRSRYGVWRAAIATTIRSLLDTKNIVLDSAAANAGLKTLDAGGDFADGVFAHQGAWLGGETFVSFDRKAVAALEKQGAEGEAAGVGHCRSCTWTSVAPRSRRVKRRSGRWCANGFHLGRLRTSCRFERAHPAKLSRPSPLTNPPTHSFQTTCAGTLLRRNSPFRSILISNSKIEGRVMPAHPPEDLCNPFVFKTVRS